MIESRKTSITGPQGPGKTAIIRNVAARLNVSFNGFFTSEIRSGVPPIATMLPDTRL